MTPRRTGASANYSDSSPMTQKRLALPPISDGAVEHYDDPAYYDHAYRDRGGDVARYVELARELGGPILELGGGNGRIAVPLARAGHKVVVVDRSRAMLRSLRERLKREAPAVRKNVSSVRGDMRTARVDRKFPLVIAPFNTVLHLYTRVDVRMFFRAVLAHLTRGGTFVCDHSVPEPSDLARDPEKGHSTPKFRHPTLGVVRYQEFFDYDRASQILHVKMLFTPTSGDVSTVRLSHRQFFPEEWLALLEGNGFSVRRVEGDFDGKPFDEQSDSMLIVATRTGRR